MSNVEVFFAFPDGRLAYECSTCDQRCCKSGSLALFPAERSKLVARHPALELVGSGSAGGIALFATPRSGCWFLEGSKCSLVESDGGKHRPVGCTMFPFNIFGLLGETLVVAPNSLCPLRVAEGGGVSHAEVSALLARLGAAGSPPMPLRPTDPPGGAMLERLVRDGVQASLDNGNAFELGAFVQLVTEAFLRRDLAGIDLAAVDPLAQVLEARFAADAAVLGLALPGPAAVGAVFPLWASLLPSLRLFAFDSIPLGKLPAASLGLLLHLAHWQQLGQDHGVSERLVPQTVAQMASALLPTLSLLAAWDDPWTGADVPALGIHPGDPPRQTARLPEAPRARVQELRALASAFAAGPAGAS